MTILGVIFLFLLFVVSILCIFSDLNNHTNDGEPIRRITCDGGCHIVNVDEVIASDKVQRELRKIDELHRELEEFEAGLRVGT